MSDFRTVLQAAGLCPRAVVPDGRWYRCATEDKPRKKNGAYLLRPDGREGYWKNYALDLGWNRWSGESVVRTDPAAHARWLREQRQRERQARIEAMRSARVFWEHCRPMAPLHPYLQRKGLSALGCAGLRQHNGQLVVPVRFRGSVISVQRINNEGDKLFWKAAPVKAGAYVLERPRAAVTCVVEGLATGLAVFQSVRTARVIVAFDAGNLLPAMQELRPTGSVVICADNDYRTGERRGVNPGRVQAQIAADLLGCGVAWPEGVLGGSSGADWADALMEWGERAARRIEREVLGRARLVMADQVAAAGKPRLREGAPVP